MTNIEVTIEGKVMQGWAEKVGETLWVHLHGRTFSYTPVATDDRKHRRRGGPTRDAGEITAPMPGKINKVMVKPGDTVTLHQIVAVMEAMKMEYTLKSAVAGSVTDVFCQAGEQVVLGQRLVKLAPHEQ